MEDIRIRFGKAVRQKRHELGVSQEAFADLCELDRTYIGGIERGERNVALVNIEKVARALKLSLSQLFRSYPCGCARTRLQFQKNYGIYACHLDRRGVLIDEHQKRCAYYVMLGEERRTLLRIAFYSLYERPQIAGVSSSKRIKNGPLITSFSARGDAFCSTLRFICCTNALNPDENHPPCKYLCIYVWFSATSETAHTMSRIADIVV